MEAKWEDMPGFKLKVGEYACAPFCGCTDHCAVEAAVQAERERLNSNACRVRAE